MSNQETQETLTYITMGSGFKYRLLEGTHEDGYEAAKAQLLDGEQLCRMMDGLYRINEELVPVLMDDKRNFEQSAHKARTAGWKFKLAAGIDTPQSSA